MSDLPDVVPGLSVARIAEALTWARGDLFAAKGFLSPVRISITHLDRIIRAVPDLQRVYTQIESMQHLDEYRKSSQEQFEEALVRRMALMRADALEEVHAMATMPMSDKVGELQVKLAAATFLAGGRDPVADAPKGGDLDQTLAQLAREYSERAPRVRAIRERVIEFETDPAPISILSST